MKVRTRIMVMFLLAWVIVSPAAGKIITVDDDGPADFSNIQAAIKAAVEGDTVIVAEGTYNENINFIGTNITLTSTEPNDPVVVANTVIQGDGTTCVVFFYGNEDASCILTGFTITGGYVHRGINTGGGITGKGTMATISHCVIRDNFTDSWGGGLFECDGLISHCIISSNTTEEYGGGLACCDGMIIDCRIIGNSAGIGGGLDRCSGTIDNCIINWNTGVGVSCCSSVRNCTIRGNSRGGLSLCSSVSNCVITGNTGYHGGGISASNSVNNCVIVGNTAYFGGGVSGCTSIISCTITCNKAEFGGGIFCTDISSTIANCTISNNRAKAGGGGIYCWGIDAIVSNCILWGNTTPQGDEIALFGYLMCNSIGCIFYPSSITISYSDVQGGDARVYIDSGCTLNWATGNIDVDPCFIDPGYWDPNENPADPNDDFCIEGDYHLAPVSTCIDAGDPNYAAGPNETDFDGKPRVIGGRIDMGAYEYSPPISAEVRILPRTINIQSKGKWIAAFIELPEGYNEADIDPNSIYLENEIEPDRFWIAEDNQVSIAKFRREEVQAILSVGEVELTITGQLSDGTLFEGTDVIKVIDKGGGKK